MKPLIIFLFFICVSVLAQDNKTPKSSEPFLDKKVFVQKDCFATDSTHFYQIAFRDKSGSFGFGIGDNLKSKDLKEIADPVMARAYRQRNNK